MSAVLESALSPAQREEADAADRAEQLRDEALMQAMRPQLIADAAEEHVLSDMDSYANWLAMQCTGAKVAHTRMGYVPTSPVNLACFVEALDVPQLLALTMYPRSEAQALACKELKDRYLAECSEYLARVQGELA